MTIFDYQINNNFTVVRLDDDRWADVKTVDVLLQAAKLNKAERWSVETETALLVIPNPDGKTCEIYTARKWANRVGHDAFEYVLYEYINESDVQWNTPEYEDIHEAQEEAWREFRRANRV